MNSWRSRLTDVLSFCNSTCKIRTRKYLEKELSKKMKIVNKYEVGILQLVRNVEDLKYRRDRQTRLMNEAKERYEKLSTDRQTLTEEVQRQELEQKKADMKQKKTLREKIVVKSRVKELKKKRDDIERRCDILWEMTFNLDQREGQREWRENLRRRRSQTDMTQLLPPTAA